VCESPLQYETVILRVVRNVGSWIHETGGSRMDQQLLPEPKHSVLTLGGSVSCLYTSDDYVRN
jgi:hypothetical protein